MEIFTLDNRMATSNHNEIISINEDAPLLPQPTQTAANRPRHSVSWVKSTIFVSDRIDFCSFDRIFRVDGAKFNT